MNHPSPYIRNLILRFLRKEASDSDLEELQTWLEADKEHVRYFKMFNELYQEEHILENFTEQKLTASWKLMESRMRESALEPERPVIIRLLQSPFLRIAASVLVAAFVIWKLLPQESVVPPVAQNTVLLNTTKRTLEYILPDSTRVWLNANSSIDFGPDFSEKRNVTLKGEAFFDVKKKHAKNFVVQTSHISIQVKGTRFNVQAYETGNEKATLEEGEIELTIRGNEERYAMAPGDQIIINKERKTITRERVDTKNFTAWKEQELVFDNAPLADILLKLENRYNVRIEIDPAVAQREHLSMTISDEPLEEILEMIHLSSALNYKTENETVVIYE